MGEIQQSVNNMISTAGIMAGLYANSPMGKKQKETRLAKGDIKSLGKQLDANIAAADKGLMSPEVFSAKHKEITQKQAEAYKTIAKNNPTEENAAKSALADEVALVFSDEATKQFEEAMKKINSSPASMAKEMATKHLDDSIAEKSLIEQFKAEPNKSKFLRQAQHIQSQEKRGGKK